MKNFYLTTPIYYVNARPHLGHAYTSIVADSITRFRRLMGQKTFLITGTDEHGDKIVRAAAKENAGPREFVDRISREFRNLLPVVGVENNDFLRTSEPRHNKCVREFLQKVYDNGDIYFGEYGGHYCYGCERFYTEKELENGLCPQHLVKPEYLSEKNYFFRMSKYQGWLREHILQNHDFIRPERYRNEVLGLLESGALEDLCISRPKNRLTWGIELPFDANYVCYVWFDALLSYITTLDWPEGEKFKEYWPGAEHLVAKDILKPHAVFWPTMLKSAGLPLYQHLNVHGYWLVRDTKMSKSLGNVIDPQAMIERYGLATFRYFLLREMHFGSDASFSEEALIGRRNADLANDLGNLFSRVLSMNAKYFSSILPASGKMTALEDDLAVLARNSFRNFQDLFSNMRFSNALESLWELIRALNKYVDSSAPWTLHKAGDQERLGTVIYTLLEYMRKISLHLWPVMPESAENMLAQLGLQFNRESCNLQAEADSFGTLTPGTSLASACNLFPRIEIAPNLAAGAEAGAAGRNGGNGKERGGEGRDKGKDASADSKTDNIPAQAAPIEFADFQKLDLRVGTVLEAEQHPNADKLLRIMVDLGEGQPRQIVSGIAAFFKPGDLVGKQVTVVANLPPRKLRGLESQGMILTAACLNENGDEVLRLLTSDGLIINGAKVS